MLSLLKERVSGEVVQAETRGSESGRYIYVDAVIKVGGKKHRVPCAGGHGCGRQYHRGLDIGAEVGDAVTATRRTVQLFGCRLFSWISDVVSTDNRPIVARECDWFAGLPL